MKLLVHVLELIHTALNRKKVQVLAPVGSSPPGRVYDKDVMSAIL